MDKRAWIVPVTLVFLMLGAGQKPDAEFIIDEEMPVSAFVGSLQEVEHLFPDLSAPEKKWLQYGILDQGDVSSSLFNITRHGGDVSIARRVDREAICLTVDNCVVKVNILAAAAQNSSQFDSRVITVHFKINDINDNAPTFQKTAIVLEVPEGGPPDSVIKISGASDRDSTSEFKMINYTLHSTHDVFSLSTYQTLDGSSEIHLRLRGALDRETQDRYELTITAQDGGLEPKSSTLSVTVHVTDVNDNEPQFVNRTYNVTVDSNTPPGQIILHVSATDADKGNNSLLSYDFTHFQKPLLQKLFHINSTTGEISATGQLPPGKQDFIVEAHDSGSPRLKGQAVVSVDVISTENSPPQISIATLGASVNQNMVSVSEPGGKGYFVALLVVTDEDGDSQDVICQIQSNVFMLVPVVSKGYKVVLQGSVDREQTEVYNVTVNCQDKGDPPMSNTFLFRVNIEDTNDNAPVFTQGRYSRTMSEGKKNKEYVVQVSASDKDTGSNSVVRYSLESNYTHHFSIEPVTGIVTAVGELDREAYPMVTFNVYATDQGIPKPQQSWAEVVVVLDDINDNKPVFEKAVFIFQVPEDVPEESVIGNLVANDADTGLNSQLQYFFTGSLDGTEQVFSVLANGSIIASAKLDREKKANYSFSVMVRDKGNPPLVSQARVEVEVLDVNDNAPVILFPKSHNHTVLISSRPETGVVLSRIIAYDDDAGNNGMLKYTLVSGNEDGAFEVSESTGELKIAQGSRLKNNKRYDIGVLVSDKGLSPKFKTASIKVDVAVSNITYDLVKQGTESQDDYILIVAVIAAVTVVFSTLIVVAICVVFRKDKHGGMKSPRKPELTCVSIHGNLNSQEKIPSIYSENMDKDNANRLSAVPKNKNDEFSKNLLGVPDNVENKSSSPGKFVSFLLNQPRAVSAEPHYIIARSGLPLPPSVSECASSSVMNTSDENDSLRRSSLLEQTDDITSDTSGDTSTGDSGRGNSIDDVNFDHIIKGDLSSRMSPRRINDQIMGRNYRHGAAEHSRRPHYHMPYSNAQEKRVPPEAKFKPTITYQSQRATPELKPYPHGVSAAKSASLRFPGLVLGQGSRYGQGNVSGFPRQLSMTSVDDDATTTTTSGSYVINPEEIRMDAFVGADIVV